MLYPQNIPLRCHNMNWRPDQIHRTHSTLATPRPTTVVHAGLQTRERAHEINTSRGLTTLGPRGLAYRSTITEGTAVSPSVRTNGSGGPANLC